MRGILERIAVALERIATIVENSPAESSETPAKLQRSKAGKSRAKKAERGTDGKFLPAETSGNQRPLEMLESIVVLGQKGPISTSLADKMEVAMLCVEKMNPEDALRLMNDSLTESPNPMAISRSQVKRLDALGKLGPQVAILIGVYIKAWQARYQTKGRPAVNGKERGILQRLVKERSTQEVSQLLQVYCQMKNDWYLTKKHDLTTFEQNLNDIVLALSGGKENNGIDYDYVFGRKKNMGDGENDGADIREPDRPSGEKVRPETLLPGDTETPL